MQVHALPAGLSKAGAAISVHVTDAAVPEQALLTHASMSAEGWVATGNQKYMESSFIFDSMDG